MDAKELVKALRTAGTHPHKCDLLEEHAKEQKVSADGLIAFMEFNRWRFTEGTIRKAKDILAHLKSQAQTSGAQQQQQQQKAK